MTTPLTLTPAGGAPYVVVSARVLMLATGAWILDVELSADSVAVQGLPSGRCVSVIGGVPMTGTIDPSSSGTFGPTASVRVVGGGNGWSKSAPARDWHADNGVVSTQVYSAVGAAVGEQVADLAPHPLGVDVIYNGNDPASAIFRDAVWFVDTLGITNVGPRPPSVADKSLIVRDWDPVRQMASFSCESLLLPNTPLVDARFKGQSFTVWNIEQVFDGNGSHGWAWASEDASPLVVAELKSAVLQWTRAAFLRVYRYRLVLYQGNGPGGGPPRMALQSVTPSAGVPDILPIAPWSGVAGVVSELAPSQEVLVTFENADPGLPRVVGFSLVSSTGGDLGIPLKTTMDASVELDIGPSTPLAKLCGGDDFLVKATPYASLISALTTFATAAAAAATAGQIATAAGALQTALAGLPPPATLRTKAG